MDRGNKTPQGQKPPPQRQSNGQLPPKPSANKPSATAPPSESAFTDEKATQLLKDLQYDAFNTEVFRDSHGLSRDQICQCICVLIQLQNSVASKVGKVVNKEVGTKMASVLASLGIKKKATSSTSLTLPRFGVGYPHILAAYRKLAELKGLLEKKVGDIDTPLWSQDPGLSAFAKHIKNNEEYQMKFGRLIKPKGTSDEAADANTKKFLIVSELSIEKDKVFKANIINSDFKLTVTEACSLYGL